LWTSSIELRDGLRASRDFLKVMRLEDVRAVKRVKEEGVGVDGEREGELTVRVNR
jgi:protein-serine/threonine kinase